MIQSIAFNHDKYQMFSEFLLKIISENVEFIEVRKMKAKNGGYSKRQISRNKLNRYIEILNYLQQNKISKEIELRRHIIKVEEY
jgi:Holliday junction resolvase-like predicted endonuclease